MNDLFARATRNSVLCTPALDVFAMKCVYICVYIYIYIFIYLFISVMEVILIPYPAKVENMVNS